MTKDDRLKESAQELLQNVTVGDRTVSLPAGRVLLHGLLQHGVLVQTACGGKGTCHLCKVKVLKGAESLPAPNAIEKKALGNVLIASGMRLSCQIEVKGPLALELPPYESIEERKARLKQSRARLPSHKRG